MATLIIVALLYLAAFPPVRYTSIFVVSAAPEGIKKAAQDHPYLITAIIWLFWPLIGLAAYYPLFHGRR